MLDAIEAYLDTLGTIAYPIRKGFMPNDVVEAMVLSEVGGTGVELGFGVDGIYLEHPLLQVVARGNPEDYVAPRAQVQLAYLALPKVQAQALTGKLYHMIVPRMPPFLMYTDEKRRPVIGFTADVTKVP